MSRAIRVEFSGACYHVMSRGVARMTTFRDDKDRRHFLAGVGGLVKSGVLVIHAYCLMPSHYHLLVSTPLGELGRWMRHVNGDYARYFNLRYRRVGHLWQGRYKAILVDGERYLLECSRYIHLNPNRARLTRPAERYRWSSYRNYVGGQSVVPWVEVDTVLESFGGDGRAYRKYCESGKGEKQVSPFERAVAGLVLGGEAFVQRIGELVKGTADASDQPSRRALERHLLADPAEVERATLKVFGQATRARQRGLLLWAQRRFSALRTTEIARRYDRGQSAVSMAYQAIERQARKDEQLAQATDKLAALLRKSDK